MNCWEHLKCSETAKTSCAAYPDNGKNCWKITGTMCDGGRMNKSSLLEKVEFCRRCGFYINYANKF